MKRQEEVLFHYEKQIYRAVSTPYKIQAYLDSLTYSSDDFYRCPRSVIQDKTAHCFDGAIFAAAALKFHGMRPLVIQLLSNGRDDVHMLALYEVKKMWGAIGKSNFVGLRFREPIYRTFRELTLSYFEDYYNVYGEKTLRGYTRPVNLTIFEKEQWETNDQSISLIADYFDTIHSYSLITPPMAKALHKKDERSLKAGMFGVRKKGLFIPQ